MGLSSRFKPPNAFRCPLEDAHEGVKLPFTGYRAPEESSEHHPGPGTFVDGVVRRVQETFERSVEDFLLHARCTPRPRRFRRALEKLVQKDCCCVRHVEDRINLGGGDRDQEIATRQLNVEETVILSTEEQPQDSVRSRGSCREFLGSHGESDEPLLVLRINSRGGHEEGDVAARFFESIDNPRLPKNIKAVHRPTSRDVSKRTRFYEDEILDVEIPHNPGDGADVPLVLRLDENYADSVHVGKAVEPNRKISLWCEPFRLMRLALKIGYNGRAFHGSQRQPRSRTVEGECINALAKAGIIGDPREAFFRTASRTDRGVSAVGNVIAFNTTYRLRAAIGAFNDRAKDVWAWAGLTVPSGFLPRQAIERWYRYYLLEDLDLDRLRRAAPLFQGVHDFRSYTPERITGTRTVRQVEVKRDRGVLVVDIRAPSFARGMVRRIVRAIVAYAKGEASLARIRESLGGTPVNLGAMPPECLVLMDVRYAIPFNTILMPRVRDEWRQIWRDAVFHLRLVQALGGTRPY